MQPDLISQAHQLRSVLARLDDAATTLLPLLDCVDWRGPAQLLYAISISKLRSDTAAARDHLSSAVRLTEQAIATMDGRG